MTDLNFLYKYADTRHFDVNKTIRYMIKNNKSLILELEEDPYDDTGDDSDEWHEEQEVKEYRLFYEFDDETTEYYLSMLDTRDFYEVLMYTKHIVNCKNRHRAIEYLVKCFRDEIRKGELVDYISGEMINCGYLSESDIDCAIDAGKVSRVVKYNLTHKQLDKIVPMLSVNEKDALSVFRILDRNTDKQYAYSVLKPVIFSMVKNKVGLKTITFTLNNLLYGEIPNSEYILLTDAIEGKKP